MASETSIDQSRCWIHGVGARVQRFSEPYNPDSSAVRVSWWECPRCMLATQKSSPVMMNAQACPVCNGMGQQSRPPWVAGDAPSWVSDGRTYPCPACRATGIVYVPTTAASEVTP